MPIKVYNGTSWVQVSDGADGAGQVNADWNATSGVSSITNKPSVFTPPTASSTTLGGIKVGSNLSIASGVLSALSGADYETFPSDGTWTKPSSGTFVIIMAWGGGGGGSYRFGGSAGGGGGACALYITPLSSLTESSYTVTVGTGGAGGASSNSSGASGGNTSFGSILTAHGGQGACWNCGASHPYDERGGKGGGFGGVGALYLGGIPGVYANAGGQQYNLWSTPAGPAVFGGGGGGGEGGNSVYGGGGGSSHNYSAGTSMMGGNGGAGGSSGTNGSVPGGGGGAGYQGSAGDGGAGRVDVYVV